MTRERAVFARVLVMCSMAAVLLGQPPEASVVRDRLDAYLRAYEPQLSTLVADEEMTQRASEADRGYPKVTNRRLLSEVAFVSLPGNAGWLGFRRIVKVNGKAIPDAGPTLQRLLSDGARDDIDQAHLLLEQSAAHNLGQPRTTNLPNLPLELLHPRHRHRFAHEVFAREKVRGEPATVLRAEEVSTPTIIQSPEGLDQQSVILAWIDQRGRLLRAQIRTRDARIGTLQFANEVRVEFKPHDTLGLLVPAEMQEEFFVTRFGGGRGTARYSNYRRFTTATRIVP